MVYNNLDTVCDCGVDPLINSVIRVRSYWCSKLFWLVSFLYAWKDSAQGDWANNKPKWLPAEYLLLHMLGRAQTICLDNQVTCLDPLAIADL